MSDSEEPRRTRHRRPSRRRTRPLTNQDWWPDQIDVSMLHAQLAEGNPLGEDFDYAEEFAKLDVDALKADVISVITTSQDWWPADYGNYGGPVHPDELARRRHLPHLRRPRRRRAGHAALRPAQQLARQRQPRQGPPAAVAGQEEVRQQDLLGRPAGVRGQRGPGVDGLQDVRLRVRPPGHLGARGDPLRRGGRVAGHRQALRRARAIWPEPLRRHHDGPDLRQSRRPRRQAGSAGRRASTSARRSAGWR